MYSEKSSQKTEELIIQANTYKNTIAFFWLASLSKKTKEETNIILEEYETVFRIHGEQNPSSPKVDIPYALSELAQKSSKYIKKHRGLKILYALQPLVINSFINSPESYHHIWQQERQRH